MKIIILAAGMGSRLGKPHPKCLTMLSNGTSIMQRQIKNLLRYFDIEDIYVVVGFKKDLIMEAFPDLTYIYNDYFDTTNTSKSLLKALYKVKGFDVLWINGDVVFEHKILSRVKNIDYSCIAVNNSEVGDEEIKYIVNEYGNISKISKEVKEPLGEAVGINYIIKDDVDVLISALEKCKDDDYFEKGIEIAINEGLEIRPLDISDLKCIEVDFVEDLERANHI